MTLQIIAHGKIGRSSEGDLVDRYIKRISWPTQITELSDNAKELPPISGRTKTILLDERGKTLSSLELSQIVGDWRDDGVQHCRFIIGPADGFSKAQRDEADLLLSFGRLTWPHMLARAMLAEQLFRITSILANHPYHRQG
ncbi:23S rRNA (pseudouridine(1915)-N(3))-methyltransferase RlmH [Sphingorhabdus lutea]|uniref:Ribosomal RNA large subunit methyltransferase H n=1 Tax=Sphingorhabdus lutea TaxID=1913578 RepID=A0A1L3JEU8_9SPHN|nr:23S rRNA (pseudouridine(1915)-N(3))-methyltransferase RlmH [Sphingorhabdus lutea]APG63656.1 23S rRNA (pseudouridine(1915)-N(3))-methyltransferase RlmH [Sphingorhabdus lutea]